MIDQASFYIFGIGQQHAEMALAVITLWIGSAEETFYPADFAQVQSLALSLLDSEGCSLAPEPVPRVADLQKLCSSGRR